MANPQKVDTIRFTVLFLSAIGIITGILLNKKEVVYELNDTVNQSFLPGLIIKSSSYIYIVLYI